MQTSPDGVATRSRDAKAQASKQLTHLYSPQGHEGRPVAPLDMDDLVRETVPPPSAAKGDRDTGSLSRQLLPHEIMKRNYSDFGLDNPLKTKVLQLCDQVVCQQQHALEWVGPLVRHVWSSHWAPSPAASGSTTHPISSGGSAAAYSTVVQNFVMRILRDGGSQASWHRHAGHAPSAAGFHIPALGQQYLTFAVCTHPLSCCWRRLAGDALRTCKCAFWTET